MPVMERATAVIVAGSGGGATTNATTTAVTPAIRINSGDVVIALSYVSTTVSQFAPSSPSNPIWQQQALLSLSSYFLYLWSLQNPVPANEPISFTRPAAGAGLAVAQVYGGVGRIGTVVKATAIGTTNPSLSPTVTTTVAGSMVVGGFVFNRGSNNAFTPSGQRVMFRGAAGTILLADQAPGLGNMQIAVPSSFSTPSGFEYVSLAVVLEPVTVTPPPPPGSIPDIVDQIRQWRRQAQQDKIHRMPPAQRAAALAQLKDLATQLKQAQIAQRSGG